ncbi:hypothetical protein IMG5_030060 [Ichthyophthirius multifiliis]|uniref:Phosphodiesterase n=1 Tax=Ichthyophthirius multifiliis TaxID=5932 RepID=G0QLG1_ICHMU|nr:hypothetical protein IMG5_030060 [Ichthyophthirius multifiliis]EGR33942.1 hypothetical protein IMG5_030060 [Ichthyophthirius multifiliis]|eukprot:XP_004039246.1 hypothetical protein IMG5_030060 [Ichthyophthirius multifiliis]
MSSINQKLSKFNNGLNQVNIDETQKIKDILKLILKSKIYDIFIIILIIIFICVMFSYFALENQQNENNQQITYTLKMFEFIELSLLLLFLTEILINIYVYSFKIYFSDLMYVLDFIIIIFSIIMLIIDIILLNQNFKKITKILRGIFRFLRLFLIFRKNKKNKKIHSQIKAPIEDVLEILKNSKQNIEDENIKQKINWCIKTISKGNIYEPILKNKDAKNWRDFYQQKVQKKPSQKLEQVKNIKQKFNQIQIPKELEISFVKIEDENFNVFDFFDKNDKENLPFLLIFLFGKFRIFDQENFDPFFLFNWASNIENGYLKNPYHNKIHAFDVLMTIHIYLEKKEFAQITQLNSLEIAQIYIAAAAHDYGHPGQNNTFLINSLHQLAIQYNDQSPLENYHAYQSFQIMKKENCNIFQGFQKESFIKCRENIINMILHTDAFHHFEDLGKFKSRINSIDFDPINKDKQLCMFFLLHSADISNVTKPWILCKNWAERVMEEFWIQGDVEKSNNLNVSFLCDRYSTNVSKSQIAFIDFIAGPQFDALQILLPKIDYQIKCIQDNKIKWKALEDFYEKQLKQQNKI